MKALLVVLFSFVITSSFSQHCSITIKGHLYDTATEEPLEFANLLLEENLQGAASDIDGHFELENVCPGDYHLRVSHIGCETQTFFFQIKNDTNLHIHLNHSSELLDEVLVHGHEEDHSSAVSATIDEQQISKSANENLADLLSSIAGVATLSNGAGISKPIVHGLFGNRITILNNEVEQAGQQWGNDHAPEIDPFVANHLSVVKGAAALEYGGSNLGSIILVEPGNISDDPHLHGQLNYIYNSNGRGSNFNTQFEQKLAAFSWKLTTTFKNQGDSKSSSYFLRNTGRREANVALQLEKHWSSSWATNFYYSYFSTTIGILRGSHIGNTTDLSLALEKEVPFFTEEKFSREIDAPKQEVAHHLAKFEAKYLISENKALKLIFASQLNDRKEFDIRRGGRSETPALSLSQWAHSFDAKYSQESANNLLLKGGLQLRLKDNTNVPGTGFNPLIPDFRKSSIAAYAITQKDLENVLLELGARIEQQSLLAFPITNTVPKEVLREERNFTNYSLSAGLKYSVNDALSINLNTGLAQRSPEVNELYSNGLHQGVSGIERGNANLQPELSLKSIISIDYKWKNKALLNILAYYQNVDDFIYLEPQREFELTIRGAFPLFLYRQTKARIYGLDANFHFEPTKHLRMNLNYAYIKGIDVTNDQGLLNIPGNNANFEINYFSDLQGKFIRNFQLGAEVQHQNQQKDISVDQDFALPPEAYTLLNFKTAFDIHIGKDELKCAITLKNALNLKYRDYLNRLRYFADDLGRNIVFRVNYKF